MSWLKPLPLFNPDRVEFNPKEIGFSLEMSEECRQQIKEIEQNSRLARMNAGRFYFD